MNLIFLCSSLLNIAFCIFSSFFILEIIKTFYDLRINLKNILLYITISTLILALFLLVPSDSPIASSYIFIMARFLLPIVIYITLNIIILKLNIKLSIIATVIYFVLLVLFDNISLVILNSTSIDIASIRQDPFLLFFYYIILFGISFLSILSFKYIKHKNNNIQINNNKLFLAITYIIITLVYMIANISFYAKYIGSIDPIIVIINAIVIFIYFILTFYTIYNSQKLFNYTEENTNLKSYINAIDNLHDELKRFRHNYANTLIGFQGYTDSNDIEGLKNYLTELIQKSQNIKNIDTFDFNKISNPALKSILLAKISTALNKNIKIVFEYTDNIRNFGINTSDLCEILGVFIDNAIEECEKLKISNRRIEIFIDNQKDICVIIIANPYKDKPEVNKIFQKNFSTKQGENRGIGLCTVKRIINSYNNVILNTLVESNSFVQELQIKIK
ncbi:MAG: hypothetical protein A2Y24_07325 [Clostridiales bacterium GWE2_32_10]|nr:MAG: hypothetical protein A2Y24_07325 [Clostridiales bacterium GWE2_32_10]HBY21097.1 hypothetical protein [Clostridiales bacterium]